MVCSLPGDFGPFCSSFFFFIRELTAAHATAIATINTTPRIDPVIMPASSLTVSPNSPDSFPNGLIPSFFILLITSSWHAQQVV